MTRTLKPHAPVAVAVATLSQLTSLALLGIDPRRFLDIIIPRCPHVAHVGRLRIVPLDDAIEVLRGLSGDNDDGDEVEADGERQPQTADAVLGALGMERVAS